MDFTCIIWYISEHYNDNDFKSTLNMNYINRRTLFWMIGCTHFFVKKLSSGSSSQIPMKMAFLRFLIRARFVSFLDEEVNFCRKIAQQSLGTWVLSFVQVTLKKLVSYEKSVYNAISTYKLLEFVACMFFATIEIS